MVNFDLIPIFEEVQNNSSCHQKYVQVLQNLLRSENVSCEEFFIKFKHVLAILFQQKMGQKTESINRCFSFCARFCCELITMQDNKSNSGNDDDDIETHPFVVKFIMEILEYQNLADEGRRFYSCQLISVLLKNLGDDALLDSQLYDSIQDAMLERIFDGKVSVRIQAISALLRLQNPDDSNCPVIKAFIQSLGDPSAVVRKTVVVNIAPCSMTISRIIERLRDVDHGVRLAAFMKCATTGPKALKIVDRQTVMLNGINEENKSVKKVFINVLFPKWLAVYDHDYIKMMTALKLDADENDIKQTVLIYEKILDILFTSEPLKDLVQALSLDDKKLIPQDKLSVETVTFWCYLLKYFEKKVEHDCSDVIPELTPLCNFIESFIKDKSSIQLTDWEYLDFQQILLKLLQIVESGDQADEVGRQLLYKLIIKTLTERKLENCVIIQLLVILQKILLNVESLSNEICMVISEIREPTSQGPNEELLSNMDFKKAEISTKLNILKHEQEQAVRKGDFNTAAKLQEEIVTFQQKSEELHQQVEVVEKFIHSQDNDPETLARALDILIALLQTIVVQKIPICLKSCKDEFVVPLLVNTNMNLHWRVFKCIALFSLLDRETALENLQFIFSPIVIYRLTSIYNKPTLLVSVGAMSDLLRLYGKSLFTNNSKNDATDDNTTNRSNGRALYKLSSSTDVDNVDFNNISCEEIIDVILDMLDDEIQDIRENAAMAITKLVSTGLMVSSSLLSRLMLKWFNPLTEKYDQKIQQLLGPSIIHFCEHVNGSAEILERAIIPTLCSIGNAPQTSPLSEVDVNNILRFLAAVTKIERDEYSNLHKNLSHSILSKIQHRKQEQCVPLLSKMLFCLDEPQNDQTVIDNLVQQTDICLRLISDKNTIKSLSKYRQKLTGLEKNTDESVDKIKSAPNSARKRVERKVSTASTLSTISDNAERSEQNEYCIETPTTDSPESQKSVNTSVSHSLKEVTVTTETPSDSKESTQTVRRSKRKIVRQN